MTNSNEEHDGVTLTVETVGWPSNLTGLVIREQSVYAKDGAVTIIGDPIWSTEVNGEVQLQFWED